MAAVAFDTLKFARRLMAAGVPEQQAEAQAELMAEAFVFNMDSLVTKDYLDARIAAQDARFDAKISARIASLDNRIANLETRVDVGFAELEGKFRLIYWMLGICVASTTIPLLHSLLVG